MELCSRTSQRSFVKIVLEKSLNDPWPIEFGGRSKWDIDRFKRWDAANGMDDETLNKHLISQFSIDQSKSQEKRGLSQKSRSALDGVRKAIKTLFVGTMKNISFLYAVRDDRYPEKNPDFVLRTHTPLRISPDGAPLLLVSALDNRMHEKLVDQKAIDVGQSSTDFERICFGTKNENKASSIVMNSAEEFTLLRYVLRLNSTRMRATAWQSKNLPRGQR